MFCCDNLQPFTPFETVEYRLGIFAHWFKAMNKDKSLVSTDPGDLAPFVVQVSQVGFPTRGQKRYFVPTDWGKFAETNWHKPAMVDGVLLKTTDLHCRIHNNTLCLRLYERNAYITVPMGAHPANTSRVRILSATVKPADPRYSGAVSSTNPINKVGATQKQGPSKSLQAEGGHSSHANTPGVRILSATTRPIDSPSSGGESSSNPVKGKARATQEQNLSTGLEPECGQLPHANTSEVGILNATIKPTDPNSPGGASSSNPIKGKARATEGKKPTQEQNPSMSQEPDCGHSAYGANSIPHSEELGAIIQSVKNAAGHYVLGLLDLTQRSMESRFAGVSYPVQIEYTKLFVCEQLDRLRESVDKDFLSWLQCLVGDNLIKFLMTCCPAGNIEAKHRETIIKATNSAIHAIFTSVDVQSTESKVLQEIASQNPGDEFLTSLVDCALERVKQKIAREERKKLEDLHKREVVNGLAAAKEEKDCLPDDASDDCHWSVVAEPPSESESLDSFSLCGDSDSETSLWEATSTEESLDQAERVMNLLETKGPKAPKGSEMGVAVDS